MRHRLVFERYGRIEWPVPVVISGPLLAQSYDHTPTTFTKYFKKTDFGMYISMLFDNIFGRSIVDTLHFDMLCLFYVF